MSGAPSSSFEAIFHDTGHCTSAKRPSSSWPCWKQCQLPNLVQWNRCLHSQLALGELNAGDGHVMTSWQMRPKQPCHHLHTISVSFVISTTTLHCHQPLLGTWWPLDCHCPTATHHCWPATGRSCLACVELSWPCCTGTATSKWSKHVKTIGNLLRP